MYLNNGHETWNAYDTAWAHPAIVEKEIHAFPVDYASLYRSLTVISDEERAERRQENCNAEIEYSEAMAASISEEDILYDIKEFVVEKGCPEEPDAPAVTIEVAVPRQRKRKKLSCIFCIPCGGFWYETSGEFRSLVYTATKADAVYVLCNYRVAPEHPWPAGLNDLHAIYQWMVENADELGINTNKVVIQGRSSGAALALCLGFRLARYGWCGAPVARGIVSTFPVMNDAGDNDSQRMAFTSPEGIETNWSSITNHIAMRFYLNERFGDPTLPPEAVPSRAVAADFKGFAPTWIFTGELDCGRDSVYDFAKEMHKAGVFCEVHAWGGLCHTGYMGVPDPEDPYEISSRFMAVNNGAIADALKYDLRRTELLA